METGVKLKLTSNFFLLLVFFFCCCRSKIIFFICWRSLCARDAASRQFLGDTLMPSLHKKTQWKCSKINSCCENSLYLPHSNFQQRRVLSHFPSSSISRCVEHGVVAMRKKMNDNWMWFVPNIKWMSFITRVLFDNFRFTVSFSLYVAAFVICCCLLCKIFLRPRSWSVEMRSIAKKVNEFFTT